MGSGLGSGSGADPRVIFLNLGFVSLLEDAIGP
jgi:hypothetical protein